MLTFTQNGTVYVKTYIKRMRNLWELLSLSQWTFIQDILIYVTVPIIDKVI